jgi:transcriptional regulator with XRE-family HTH domain
MKNRKEIRLSLGLSQQDMAELLNVSRPHVSMYESGLRNLPASALQMLAELQEHATRFSGADNRKSGDAHSKLRHREVERMLEDCILRHHALEQKRKQLLRKHVATTNRVHIKDFQFKDFTPDWPLVLPKKSNAHILKECDTKLVRMEIQLELLESERVWLESKLKELSEPK